MSADLASFNEDRFLPSPLRASEYYARVEAGRLRMKDQKIVITGLARNIAPVLGKTMARIERTGQMFRDYRVVIFENDSKDNTAEQLNGWSKINSRVTAISEERLDPINPGKRCLDRATRMATYRNKYREHINAHLTDYDSVMVIDLDLPGGWSYDGIANSFGQETEWDFVGSNGIIFKDYEGVQGRQLYYDAWAFRSKGRWEPMHAIKVNPLNWPRGEPLFPVNSCFGGLGIYKMEAMRVASYDGSDCEHVPFHRQMVAAGLTNLFLNPSQIVLY
jgi:hypothetical protein